MWRVGDALRKAGHSVTVVSTQRPSSEMNCHDFLQAEVARTVYAWPFSLWRGLVGLLVSRGKIRGIHYVLGLKEGGVREKLKVLAMIPIAAVLAHKLRKRGIEHLIVHSCANAAHLVNLVYLMGGPTFSLRLGGDLEVYGLNHNAKFSHALFTIPASLNNKDQILERGFISPQRILPTWLGVDTDKFKPVPKGSKRADQSISLLTIARLNPAKGHEYALRAMASAVKEGFDLTYTIAGSGPHKEALQGIIGELGLESRVDLVGQVDESEAIEYLQRADVFILPSIGLGEASPVSLIEAMSCGLPSISSIIGGTPQIITHDYDGLLVPQKDIEALSKALLSLYQSDDLRLRLGRNARKSAEDFFSCRDVAASIVHSYEELIANPQVDIRTFSPLHKKTLITQK